MNSHDGSLLKQESTAEQAGSGGAPNPPAAVSDDHLTRSEPGISESYPCVVDKRPREQHLRDCEDSSVSKRMKGDRFDSVNNHDASLDKGKDILGAAGSSCHQCKSRRSISDLIFCTNVVDKKNKHCRKKYCDGCLKKFYKEEASEIECRSKWICPSCRKMCCCAACRRRRDEKDRPQGPAYSFESNLYASNSSMQPNGVATFLPGMSFGQLQGSASSVFGPSNGSGQNSSFALLYAVAQMPRVRATIKQILDRKDISDEDKVEAIAALLRRAVSGDESASVSESK